MSGPPGWTLTRADAQVFLFGVRPGARDDSWLTKDIRTALAACDEFWRETPPEDEITSSPLLAELGLSPDVPLSQRLDVPTMRRLDAAAESLAIDRAALEVLRPWVAAQLVQQGTLSASGIPPDQNMDVVLADAAQQHGAVVRFEFDVEGILRMFGDLSEALELEYLRFILDAAEAGAELIDEGFAAWLGGDRSIDELGDADFRQRYPDLYEPFIRRRNAAWIPRLDEMLSRPGTRFVAVGCGHLAGPDSVLALAEVIECGITESPQG
jgi:uncharacterized protein